MEYKGVKFREVKQRKRQYCGGCYFHPYNISSCLGMNMRLFGISDYCQGRGVVFVEDKPEQEVKQTELIPRTTLTPEQIEKINQMTQKWTDDYSHNRAIEELLELSLSLLHLSRNKIERSEVKKEMADGYKYCIFCGKKIAEAEALYPDEVEFFEDNKLWLPDLLKQ